MTKELNKTRNTINKLVVVKLGNIQADKADVNSKLKVILITY